MTKIPSLILCLLALAFLATGALADTVTLKNGEHLDGKITAETDKDVTISVQVSAGITDDKVIPKAQIEKIDKASPEVEAYKQISAVQLGTNSMSSAQYDPYIQALQAFLNQYPKSSMAAEVQKTLNAFSEEKKRVVAGEIKMDNEWLSKERVRKEKVQIYGQLEFGYMKSLAAQGKYVDALNVFGTIEKNYLGAAVMPDAIDLAQQCVIQLQAAVTRAIPNQKAEVEQQKKDAAAAGPADRTVMTAAIKRQQDAEDAAVAAAQASAWPPFYPNNEKSLTALMTRLKTEGPRLAGLPIDKMKESLQETLDAKQSLASGDVTGAGEKLKDALQLWPGNEYAGRLNKDTTAAQQAAAVKAAATPKPAAAATPESAAPKMRRSAPLPQADSAGTAAAGSSSAPAPATTTAAPAAAPAADSDDGDSFITLPRIIMAVALVALLAVGGSAYMKKKKREAEEA